MILYVVQRAFYVAASTIRNSLSAIKNVRARLGDDLPLIPTRIKSLLFKGLEQLQIRPPRTINPMLPSYAIKMNMWLFHQSQYNVLSRRSIIAANILRAFYMLRGGEYLTSTFWQDSLKKLTQKNLILNKWEKMNFLRGKRKLYSQWEIANDLQRCATADLRLYLTKHQARRSCIPIKLVGFTNRHFKLDVLKALSNIARLLHSLGVKFCWNSPLLPTLQKNTYKPLSASFLNKVTKEFCDETGFAMFYPHDRMREGATAMDAAKSLVPGLIDECTISLQLRHTPTTTRLYIIKRNSDFYIQIIVAFAEYCIYKLPNLTRIVVDPRAKISAPTLHDKFEVKMRQLISVASDKAAQVQGAPKNNRPNRKTRTKRPKKRRRVNMEPLGVQPSDPPSSPVRKSIRRIRLPKKQNYQQRKSFTS